MKSRERLKQSESYYVASQWQLIRWKFSRHKLAMISLAVLALFYFVAIFAEFFSPYDPNAPDRYRLHSPPQRLRFVDGDGKFRIRPFVYGIDPKTDERTLRRYYELDTGSVYRLRFFVHGDPYKLWGFIQSDLHFFGTVGGKGYLLGADRLGRDLLSRIIYGGRISLSIGLVGIAITSFLGILIGGISGYYGGAIDIVIQRFIEFIRSIPTLPLWMGLSAALPPYWSGVRIYFGIVIILSLVGWTELARVVRGKFLSLREEDFVMAARFHGAGEMRIIFKHLLPSFYSYVIARVTLSIPAMILGETSLSFIGLGLQPPTISWGVLLKESQSIPVLAHSPWLLIPGLFIVVTILAFNFVGDGLRDAADPYARV